MLKGNVNLPTNHLCRDEEDASPSVLPGVYQLGDPPVFNHFLFCTAAVFFRTGWESFRECSLSVPDVLTPLVINNISVIMIDSTVIVQQFSD